MQVSAQLSVSRVAERQQLSLSELQISIGKRSLRGCNDVVSVELVGVVPVAACLGMTSATSFGGLSARKQRMHLHRLVLYTAV